MKYYSVKVGRTTGIFETWADCEKEVKGYSGAIYKSFPTRIEAELFLDVQNGQNTAAGRMENIIVKKEGEWIAYCDGSYQDGKGGCGVLTIIENGIKQYYANAMDEHGKMSNQISELIALRQTLLILREEYKKDTKARSISIFSDSNYTVQCVTEWYKKWDQNGWRTANGTAVDHQTIIQECLASIRFFENENVLMKIVHIYGHGKDPNETHRYFNAIVDTLAAQGRSCS